MHYYKFNIADWGLSTSHLSLDEEAIYFRLVNFYYDSESPIPLETQSVFRRLRMGSHAETASSVLAEFFQETDKGWIHTRCDNVLKDYRKTSKKNKVNGAKGGRPPKTMACKETQIKPNGLPNESQNNPNQEPLTTNHKPLTKVIKTSRFAPPSQVDAANYFQERSANDPNQQAEGFIDFYESKGWMVGKNKMKDWKAAIRNWLKRSNNNGQHQQAPKKSLAERTNEQARAIWAECEAEETNQRLMDSHGSAIPEQVEFIGRGDDGGGEVFRELPALVQKD